MANSSDFILAGNDEHGIDPPTFGKRTPVMPYINRPFYENEYNRPAKNYFLAHSGRLGFGVFDVKPEPQDTAVAVRVQRVNARRPSIVITFAYNATEDTNFNSWGGLEVFYSLQNAYSARSRILSDNVFEYTARNGYIRGNAVGTLAEVGMLSSVQCPATLLEAGFMTNFNEAKIMMDPDYQALSASLALEGVCRFLSVPYFSAESTGYPVLGRTDRGGFVYYLQFKLKNYGFTINADGDFGPATESVVKDFQTQNSLSPDGIVGAMTWAKINNFNPQYYTLRRGSRGVEVWYLQRKLLSKLYPISIDADFGPATENAVRAFQSENGLVADGIVGANTWAGVRTVGGGRNLPASY